MSASRSGEVTAILLDADGSTVAPSLERLVPVVYDELHRMAGRRLRLERRELTLSTTELVHEAYMRLADTTRVTARGRAYFFAAAAQAMRRILVDHARRRSRQKRGGGKRPVTLNEGVANVDGEPVDVLPLEEGLERLSAIAERAARVVECRFYGGLSIEDTALALGVTPRTVNRDWQFARAWLYDHLTADAGQETS